MLRLSLFPTVLAAVLAGCASSAPDDVLRHSSEPAELAQSQAEVTNWFIDNGYVVRECAQGPIFEGVRGTQVCLRGPTTDVITLWTYESEAQARRALGRIRTHYEFRVPEASLSVRRSVHQSGPLVVYFRGDNTDLTIQRDLTQIVGPPQ